MDLVCLHVNGTLITNYGGYMLSNLLPPDVMIHLEGNYDACYDPRAHEITIYRRDVLGLNVMDRIGTGVEYTESDGWIDIDATYELLGRYYTIAR